MANWFNLTLDTLAPVISSFTINNGAAVTTNRSVTLRIGCDDATSMKIWGIDGAVLESDASWEAFSETKTVSLTSGDGTKTVYVKVRDSVYNESTASHDDITLSTSIPNITINGPDVSIISENAGKNVATFTFTSNMALKAWKVKLVPANSSTESAGVQIPSTAGSINMTGGVLSANTPKECKINGTDLATAAGGADGTYIIKVFGQSSDNNLWSA